MLNQINPTASSLLGPLQKTQVEDSPVSQEKAGEAFSPPTSGNFSYIKRTGPLTVFMLPMFSPNYLMTLS